MGNQKVMKRILAGVLAAMLGLSALGGLVMAFADEKEPDISLPDPLTAGEEYVEPDDDWALLVLDGQQQDVTVRLGDSATLTMTPGSTKSLWAGFSNQYNTVIEQLAERYCVNFDVLDFVFSNELTVSAAMTFSTDKPYLYRVTNGKLETVNSTFADGVHSFTTQTLDCFVASDSELAL